MLTVTVSPNQKSLKTVASELLLITTLGDQWL